jgi:hypothetical protein
LNKTKNSTAAVFGAVVLALASVTGASASESPRGDVLPPESQPDRIINIDQPVPQPGDRRLVSSSEKGEVFVSEEGEFPVIPKPGETVRIVYTDAVTEVTTEPPTKADLESCTHSLTVEEPRLGGNRVSVSAAGVVSAGCKGPRGFFVRLYGGGWERGSNNVVVPNNGSKWIIQASSGSCGNTSEMGWLGIASWPDGGAIYSPAVNLRCSV